MSVLIAGPSGVIITEADRDDAVAAINAAPRNGANLSLRLSAGLDVYRSSVDFGATHEGAMSELNDWLWQD